MSPFVIDVNAAKQQTVAADVEKLLKHLESCPLCGGAYALAELSVRRHIAFEEEKKKQANP
ncbi:MAG: hypothetical protein NTV88_03575 [Candidatus Micrarchaeota archaeon]|nr:hypothetical protein [Candidatus Micrarchaeota archaeon]